MEIWTRFGAPLTFMAAVALVAGAVWFRFATRRRTAAGWTPRDARRTTVAEIGLVVCTVPWIGLIMTPTPGTGGLMLVPFHDLREVLGGSDSIVQVVGNLLALSGIGFWLPIRFRLAAPRWVPLVVLAIGGAVSVVLEVLQFLLPIGRVTSIDDVIVNALGAALASLCSIPWWASRR